MISSLEPARALNSAATGTKKIPVHIKVDTGMGRSGVWVDEAIPFIEEVLCLKNLEVEGIMTHFSSADDPEADEYTLGQINAFESLWPSSNEEDMISRMCTQPIRQRRLDSLKLVTIW